MSRKQLCMPYVNLKQTYEHYKNDKEFCEELKALYRDYAGRPSMLYYAEKMTKDLNGPKILSSVKI